MNDACIFCKKPLNKEYRFNEHIIPQCMEGRLQSRKEAIAFVENCDNSQIHEKILKNIFHVGDKARIYPMKRSLKI